MIPHHDDVKTLYYVKPRYILGVIDPQDCFMDEGSLGVPGARSAIPFINECIENEEYELVFATQDWHPSNHGSFADNNPGAKEFELGELDGLPQVFWPRHGEQNTPGAEFVKELSPRIHIIIRKGMNPLRDSYSGVKDNGDKATAYYTPLRDTLRQVKPDRIDLVGFATDYCVGYTALDLRELGYNVRVLLRGCRGVNPETTREMIQKLIDAGVEVVEWNS